MAEDKKNIPDAGRVDEPPKPGKVEPVKADSPVQDQPTPAKAEAPKEKDAPAKEGCRSLARTRSRPRSPAWEIPPPLGK